MGQELPAAAEGIQNEMYRDGEDLGTGAGDDVGVGDPEAVAGYWYKKRPEFEEVKEMEEPAADPDGVTELPDGPDIQDVRIKSKGVD